MNTVLLPSEQKSITVFYIAVYYIVNVMFYVGKRITRLVYNTRLSRICHLIQLQIFVHIKPLCGRKQQTDKMKIARYQSFEIRATMEIFYVILIYTSVGIFYMKFRFLCLQKHAYQLPYYKW